MENLEQRFSLSIQQTDDNDFVPGRIEFRPFWTKRSCLARARLSRSRHRADGQSVRDRAQGLALSPATRRPCRHGRPAPALGANRVPQAGSRTATADRNDLEGRPDCQHSCRDVHRSHALNAARRPRICRPGPEALDPAMTVRDEVRALVLRLSPQGICDDCIAERLGLSVRQHSNHKTRELAGIGGFERRKDLCGLCGAEKLVIRKV